MRENRTYGSEGGEAKAFPTPIGRARVDPDSSSPSVAGTTQLFPRNPRLASHVLAKVP